MRLDVATLSALHRLEYVGEFRGKAEFRVARAVADVRGGMVVISIPESSKVFDWLLETLVARSKLGTQVEKPCPLQLPEGCMERALAWEDVVRGDPDVGVVDDVVRVSRSQFHAEFCHQIQHAVKIDALAAKILGGLSIHADDLDVFPCPSPAALTPFHRGALDGAELGNRGEDEGVLGSLPAV